jgi:cytochrome b6-f complex iron-sulfur subunit
MDHRRALGEVPRRDLLRAAAGCAVVCAACSTNQTSGQPVAPTSRPGSPSDGPALTRLTAVSDVTPGAPLDVSAAAGAPTFLVRNGSSVRALSGVCTHAGCPVVWRLDQRQFVCPCHGGTYTSQGAVVSGPPPRPLDRLPVRIKNGNVYLAE